MNTWMIIFVVGVLATQMWSFKKVTSEDPSDKEDGYFIAIYFVTFVMYGGFWLTLSLAGFWSLW